MEEKANDLAVKKHPLSQLQPAMLPPLATRMGVDLVVNEKSDIWLLHDKPFAEIVKWIEFHQDLNKVILIMASGKQQELGMVVPEDIAKDLRHGRQIYLVHMQDKKISDCGMVPLMVHTRH